MTTNLYAWFNEEQFRTQVSKQPYTDTISDLAKFIGIAAHVKQLSGVS